VGGDGDGEGSSASLSLSIEKESFVGRAPDWADARAPPGAGAPDRWPPTLPSPAGGAPCSGEKNAARARSIDAALLSFPLSRELLGRGFFFETPVRLGCKRGSSTWSDARRDEGAVKRCGGRLAAWREEGGAAPLKEEGGTRRVARSLARSLVAKPPVSPLLVAAQWSPSRRACVRGCSHAVVVEREGFSC
jgi:hypothetical protein